MFQAENADREKENMNDLQNLRPRARSNFCMGVFHTELQHLLVGIYLFLVVYLQVESRSEMKTDLVVVFYYVKYHGITLYLFNQHTLGK